MNNENSGRFQFDLIIIFLLFMATSLAALYNWQELTPKPDEFVQSQLIWYCIGAVLIFFIRMIDLNQLYLLSFYVYIIAVIVLAVLLVSPESIASRVHGAKSWFQFPGVTVQPAEFAKITTIMCLAGLIAKHKEKYVNKSFTSDFLLLVKMAIIVAIPEVGS